MSGLGAALALLSAQPYGLQCFTKYSGHFASLHFLFSGFPPSFILTCCWKCSCCSHLIASSLTWGLSLCFCCHSAFYPFSLCFLCSLLSVLQCVLATLSPLGSAPICSSCSLQPFPKAQVLLGWGNSSILWLLLMAVYSFYTCTWQWLFILSVFFTASESTTTLCFYASKLDLSIIPSHCSALWVTFCCLFCGVSGKSSSFSHVFPWIFVSFLHNLWLFYHQCKCKN